MLCYQITNIQLLNGVIGLYVHMEVAENWEEEESQTNWLKASVNKRQSGF